MKRVLVEWYFPSYGFIVDGVDDRTIKFDKLAFDSTAGFLNQLDCEKLIEQTKKSSEALKKIIDTAYWANGKKGSC
ncbi:hypothetical protein C1H46_042998 [Malus baccata]|uniref:Uncharacterized protein n=1 Tax=Malus baccata TaxID=106549 RepID=A0A540KBF8_MALBA|nr:hypothetical protein C1H46_042998 [Malus baccata]